MDPNQLDEVARRHGIRLMVTFGSAVTGRTHDASDLDIAVLLEQPDQSLGERADLHHDLQRVFAGREVDLAILNRADPLFLKQVTERCSLLYGSARRLHELTLYAFRRYQDHRKYLALERDYVTRTLQARAAE
jgi:predicted nucleotidyltransferase